MHRNVLCKRKHSTVAGHRNPKEKTHKTLKIGLIKIHVNKVIKASPIYSSALSEQCCSDTPAAPTGAFDAPRSPYSGEQASPGTQWPLKVGTPSLRKPFEPSEPTPRLGLTSLPLSFVPLSLACGT